MGPAGIAAETGETVVQFAMAPGTTPTAPVAPVLTMERDRVNA